MRKGCRMLTAVMLAGLLTGCVNSSSEDVIYTVPSTISPVNDYSFITSASCLFVKRDGQVISADVEEFSADYYDLSELQSKYVDPAINAYNSKAGEGKVSLSSLTMVEDKADLRLKFATGADFVAFNKDINKYYANWGGFDVVEFEKLAESGYSLPTDIVASDGSAVKSATITSEDKLYVCVIDIGGEFPTGFNGAVSFEGDIAYVSAGQTIFASNSVVLANAPGLQYIIFK